MPKRRRGKKKRRYADAPTEAGQEVQRQAAFAAIRALYCEALPLWRSCARGSCRRHQTCGGEGRACLARAWPLMPPQVQNEAWALVRGGGRRGIPPATQMEAELRRFPPSNFVH